MKPDPPIPAFDSGPSTVDFVEQLRVRSRMLERRVLGRMQDARDGGRFGELQRAYSRATGRFLEAERFAAHYAQALACADLAASLCDLPLAPGAGPGAADCGAAPWIQALSEDRRLSRRDWPAAARGGTSDPSLTHFYEQFLADHDALQKSQHGVYYTPQPVAAFVARSLHEALRHEFGLADGLADTATWGQVIRRAGGGAPPPGVAAGQPFVRILDPAAGTGAFLVEVIDVIHEALLARWRREGRSSGEMQRRWRQYVPRHLLPRLFGLELLLPPLVVAHVQILAKLAATGYTASPGRIHLYLADTLRDPITDSAAVPGDGPWSDEVAMAERVRCALPITVVIGNPPFSGISDHRGDWITLLMRGQSSDGSPAADYYRVDGRHLGERKHWLQDDYVKFFRYAHWCIERSGAGLVGLVTNHGYLDNATFRGMRQQLINTFPQISVLDLHGNRKKKETPPGAGRDENVFGVEQGVAVGLFRRPLGQIPPSACYGELWGPRAQKLAALDQAAVTLDRGGPGGRAAARGAKQRHPTPAWQAIEPRSPYYFLTPQDDALLGEYRCGVPLNQIMPLHSTAAVTARDGFVVAWDRQELLARMQRFRDLSIPDAEIRQKYFTRGRSRKYLAGDTRGWKLCDARRRMAGDRGWESHVRSCLYRPFDRRCIYWTDWMIDWPRPQVMRHMTAGPNIALVARRQMLPTQACNYFWISDDVTLDGVIRSDNRGSESLFPLYLYDDAGGRQRRQTNVDAGFVADAGRRLRLEWVPDGQGDLRRSWGPEDLLHYIYAQFHSPAYRTRYAAGLRVDFPRVLLTGSRRLFRRLCQLGCRLRACHLAERLAAPVQCPIPLAAGFPRYRQGRVFVNDSLSTGAVAPRVWRFQVGGYQVCKKWLKDRCQRGISELEWAQYLRMLAAIATTLRLMRDIERSIAAAGGWPQAFLNA